MEFETRKLVCTEGHTSLNPEGTGITTFFGGKPDRYTNNLKDEVLFYKKQGNTNQFFVLKHTNGNAFDISNLASFSDTDVSKFDPNNSGTVIDYLRTILPSRFSSWMIRLQVELQGLYFPV